jgi:hypothetical protein
MPNPALTLKYPQLIHLDVNSWKIEPVLSRICTFFGS